MAITEKREVTQDVTADRLLAILTSPDFQTEQREAVPAVIEARFVQLERTVNRLEFEIQSMEYARGMFGLNKKKTITTKTLMQWNLTEMCCRWVYTTPWTDRLTFEGNQRVESANEGARLYTEVYVEVRVPLLGQRIEKQVVAEMRSDYPRHDAVLRRYVFEETPRVCNLMRTS